MKHFTNIAAYKFAPLKELKPLRSRLLSQCKAWELKGTILLSPEGINLFIAGTRDKVDLLLADLRALPGLADLAAKYSQTDYQPFIRMLVRIKKEIIAFGVEGIDPARRTSPKLSARELKQWLDEGRQVTLLDTRNDYEVKLGTFANARPIGIDHFRDFPKAVGQLPEKLKEQPIVMFCTGGIRCEKAGPLMEREGFKHIFQLDGGILKYFEECGDAHYQGECFVFDQRTGVDPALHETGSTTCFVCQTPLTSAEQRDPRFVRNVSCPYCFKTHAEQMAANIARRHETIREVFCPLPGSAPYDNFRPINISASCDGCTLVEALSRSVRALSAAEWKTICEQGLILDAAYQPVPGSVVVQAGGRFYHKHPSITEPDVSAQVEILHEDEALIVLNKPAPLPMHPGGRFNRNTLQHLLSLVYHPQKPRPAHRLDANTTGLMLVSRTRHFAARLQPQFERGEVEKVYLVRVQGHPVEDHFVCDAALGDSPSQTGSRTVNLTAGVPARTNFLVLERRPDGTALIEARPMTGRTNQIRVHLWHCRFPVCGDPTYLKHQALGSVQTLSPADPPLCLHSWKLRFKHPMDDRPMAFETAYPRWAQAGLSR